MNDQRLGEHVSPVFLTAGNINTILTSSAALALVAEAGVGRRIVGLASLRRDWSRWVVRVTDDDQKSVFNLPFPEAT
jgi:hypothetical protein